MVGGGTACDGPIRARSGLSVVGQGPVSLGAGQSEHQQPPQVEPGHPQVQPVIIFPGAAVSDFAVAADQPGDGPFDHRPVLPVNLLKLRRFRLSAGGSEQLLLGVQDQRATGAAGRLCIGHDRD